LLYFHQISWQPNRGLGHWVHETKLLSKAYSLFG
jgi:hypothetical protein